jgi:NodT family efflux transporter outer membrane factor (OMF) lipoprotein
MVSRLNSTAVLICLLLGGCANLTAPATQDINQRALEGHAIPAQWQTASRQAEFDPRWLGMGDNVQSLVDEALANNPGLQAAAQRVAQSRLLVQQTGAALWPTVGVGAKYATDPTPGEAVAANGYAIVAHWELDVWGRVRAEQKSAQASNASAEADYAYARQSLAAATIRAWLLATETSLQLDLLQQQAAASERELTLVQVRRRVGKVSGQDVLSAQAQTRQYADATANLTRLRGEALRSLELLLGRYPSGQASTGTLPVAPPTIAAGMPMSLLDRRPDLIAARQRYEAAWFGTQEARAARLPTISLSAGAGRLTKEFFDMVDVRKTVYPVGASILWPIFDAGLRQTQVEIRTVQQQQALIEYTQTVLTAMGEVENAMNAERVLESRQAILNARVGDLKQALSLAERKRSVGKADDSEVLQQQIQLYAAQGELVRVQAERLSQRVALHLALGGSFETKSGTVPATVQTSGL